MIKITAESKGNQTELAIKIEGNGETIVTEAVHIMQQLPKQIQGMNKTLFFRFLADLTETGMFDVGVKPEDPEEGEDDDE